MQRKATTGQKTINRPLPLSYHVLKSSVQEALAAIKSTKVKALPKKDFILLQQTASALLNQITLCLQQKDKDQETP